MKTILSSRRHHYLARFGTFLTAVALIAGMVGCGPTEVTFTDPNLEAAVRVAVAIPERPIYPSDLDELASLNATERNIADLTGLECCTSLLSLNLNDNLISAISSLSNLTSLTFVGLSSNQISRIDPSVQNDGLGPGDVVLLYGNPLSWDSINIYIPELEARGVNVEY